ncbi:MAG: class I SAM-dependent methyltransferase [Methanobacteriota archaeon]|nr:MAG: class I SAM-dependent methyltransferase [Euryarchaeota archaeon]
MDYMEANRLNWNDRVPIHLRKNDIYDLDAFRAGKLSFCANEHLELTEVKGKRLLHLQCHFGLDTMSWTRLGAKAVGIDFSEEAIQIAENLKKELGLDTEFICCNVYDVPERIDEKFDIVFTSVGALTWLPDLEKWARVIFQMLKPGGRLYVKDSHPASEVFEYINGELKVHYPYFRGREPFRFEEDSTYTSSSKKGEIRHATTYQWLHSFSYILNSVIQAGLQIDKILESPHGFFKRFPPMQRNEDGVWEYPGNPIPLTFTLFASKPE